ncbi:Pycsar system effector family protein [Streptomyces sp. NPDC046931]|uniref:Pycsar system effector family protein n=1 Tax=Streptomyces sp. NPDC046931 TaxID=3154806 RepID=UPI0033CEB522
MTAPAPGPAPAPPAGGSGADPAALPRLCERLLTELRAEIARADSKASVLVAALGMTAGVFSGLLAGRRWTPTALSGPGTVLWWAGAVCLALSLFALLLAVLPRYRSGTWAPGLPLSYFGDIQQAVRQGRLESALADTECLPTAGLTRALTETSRIAARKHQWIRAGLVTFGAGTVLLPASLLIG